MFSVVVPVHNGVGMIRKNVKLIQDYIAAHKLGPYEIVLVENGSSDSSLEICRGVAAEQKSVGCHSLPFASLSLALVKGTEKSRGDTVIYLPIDLSFDLSFMDSALALMARHDLVLGSKYMEGAVAERSALRSLFSRVYGLFIRIFFNVRGLKDLTGVKCFNRKKFLPYLKHVPKGHNTFDIALPLIAIKKGYELKEIPATVKDTGKSSFNIFLSIFLFLKGLIDLKLVEAKLTS